MASQEELEVEQDKGSWYCPDEDPNDSEVKKSTRVVVAGDSGRDDADSVDQEICGVWSQDQERDQALALSSRPPLPTLRPSVHDCLNVPEEELADLPLDVYNMFYLSDINSQGFYYSITIFVIKISLYVLVMVDLIQNKEFPAAKKIESTLIVKATQLFLMPVAILMQEELLTTFFIISRLKYSPEILRRNPGAHKWKFYAGHSARLLDGLMFLFINICVMLLQTDDVLALFLNFAALQFLQTVDNMALSVCLDGYWTRSLQKLAKDVVDLKFAYRHHYLHYFMQTSFFVVVWLSFMGFWVAVQVRSREAAIGS